MRGLRENSALLICKKEKEKKAFDKKIFFLYLFPLLSFFSFWNGVYDDFQNQWLNFKNKINFLKWQKNLSTNKNQTTYFNKLVKCVKQITSKL